MQYSIYLHKELHDYLAYFGDLSCVIQRLIEASWAGQIPAITDLATTYITPTREGATRYNITIHNEEYELLKQRYGNRYSTLRPLVYWAVENEIPRSLGWTPQPDNKTAKRRLDELRAQVGRCTSFLLVDEIQQLNNIIDRVRRRLV